MKKLDRKGFTLVELLSVIVITSLVLIVAVYGIFKVKDSAKEKTIKLSLAGIKSSASLYSGEAPSSEWRIEKKEGKESFEYFCVTVGELMNKGIIKKNSVLPDGYDKDTFLFVKRNPLTKDVIGEYLPKEYDENHNICNGYTKVDDELITKYPKITGHKAYTDKLEVDFEKGNIFSLNEDGSKTELKTTYSCEVGTNSRNMSSNNTNIVGNKCIITDLTNNTPYIVRIIMKSDNTIAPTDGNARTADFNDVIFNKDSNQVINVKFNPKDNKDNFINPYYKYLKSSLNAISSIPVIECDNDLNCNNVGTTNIIAGKWYLLDKEIYMDNGVWHTSNAYNVDLTFKNPDINTKVYIYSKMKDSRNMKDQRSEEFTILADNKKPTINIININNGKWTKNNYSIKLLFDDEISGINPNSLAYSVDDNLNYIKLDNTSESTYIDHMKGTQNNKLYYKICDNVGLCAEDFTEVKIDQEPPVIKFTTDSSIIYENNNGIDVYATCSDEHSGVEKNQVSTHLASPAYNNKVWLTCIDKVGNQTSNFNLYSIKEYGESSACTTKYCENVCSGMGGTSANVSTAHCPGYTAEQCTCGYQEPGGIHCSCEGPCGYNSCWHY